MELIIEHRPYMKDNHEMVQLFVEDKQLIKHLEKTIRPSSEVTRLEAGRRIKLAAFFMSKRFFEEKIQPILDARTEQENG